MGPVSPLPQLIDPAVQGNPLVQAMQKYLQQRNAYPIMKQERPGNGAEGSDGAFQYGDDYPKQGVMTVKPNATADTYPHELTHAVMRQLVNQYYEQVEKDRSLAGADNPQFLDLYNKSAFRDAQRTNMKQVAPKWTAENEDYRTSPTEAPAWSVGNIVGRQISPNSYVDRSPSHIDANMVTQLSMLLEAAMQKQPGK